MFAYYKRQDNFRLPYMRDATRKQPESAPASKDQTQKPTGAQDEPTETDDMRRRQQHGEQAARLSRESYQVLEQEVTDTGSKSRAPNHMHQQTQIESKNPNSRTPPARLAKSSKVRTNNPTTTTTTTTRRAKWFDPQVWWHYAALTTCLLLMLCAFTSVSCEESSIVKTTGGSEQQQQIEVATNSDKPAAQISPDDTQQKVSEDSLGAPASDAASQDASATKSSAAAAASANSGEQSAETVSQRAADSVAPATDSPAPSDLDSAAATATNLQQQQQQATVQQQLEEIPASVPTPQDVSQDTQQQQEQVPSNDDHQHHHHHHHHHHQQDEEQQTRAATTTNSNSNYENDLLPVSQYGGDSFGKKQHASGPADSSPAYSHRARDSASGPTKTSRSLKRAFGGAHMGVFGRKRTHQLAAARHQQQEQLTTAAAAEQDGDKKDERPRSSKSKVQAHHHHYYYQTDQQQHQEPVATSGGKQRHQQLKQADYPDYKEILVQPDNYGAGAGQEYEVQRQQVDVARSQQTTTSAPASKFEQDKVGVSDSDGALPTETTTTSGTEATTTVTNSADHSGFDVAQQQHAQGGGGETAKDSQIPYIRLSNIATINSTSSNSSSASHAAGAGEMKLMRIYVIDLDQKLVVGGSSGQNTYSPMASILDGATTTAASTTSKTNPEQQQQQQVSEAVEQVKVDSDSLDQQPHPYSENAAQLMQTQQSSTVYATTGAPTAASEADLTLPPATDSNLSPLSELTHYNHTANHRPTSGDIGSQHQHHHASLGAGGSNYTGQHQAIGGYNYSHPQQTQQVVVVSDDYQKYAQHQQAGQMGAPRQPGEFVYVDRDSLHANLSQIMAQMAHNSYSGVGGPVVPPQASVGHFYHYPNHMLMTMSHQQPAPHNYSLVGSAQPGQQYYAANHQQQQQPVVNYGSPLTPENHHNQHLVYLNPNNNETHHTNDRNQYLGKSARAAAGEPPASANWSQPALAAAPTHTASDHNSQSYQLQSLSVAYPSFIQQAAGFGGQFAAVYPAAAVAAPMQHHQAHQPLVMSVPQYIAPQYAATAAAAARPALNYSTGPAAAHDTTTGHAMIVPQQQPTVSIYKQQQQLVAAKDSGEQYSPAASPVEWQTTAEGHPSSSSSPASSAYNTQQQQVVALANDTNYKQSLSGGPDPADKYQLPAANKSHLYVYSQQQPSTVAEYLMYQQAQQQQHPILPTGGYAQPGQTSEPGQQQQQYYYAQAQAQAQVDPYGAGGKVTTQQQQQQQSDHWKPVDFASPATSTNSANFYPLKSGAGQHQQQQQQQATGGPAPLQQQSNPALLNGYSGQPDHDIVSLSARQHQQQRALYSANSSQQSLTPTAAHQQPQQLLLGYGAQALNASAPLPDSEHAHLSGANYQQPPRPLAYVNSQTVELAPSQQVHAHPSFSPSAAAQYNGTGSQISAAHQIGVTNEYAGLLPLSLPPSPLQQQASYTSKRYKQPSGGGEQISEEAPKIPHAHSSLTSTQAVAATSTGYRRPSDTSAGSYAQQTEPAEAGDEQQHQDDSSYESAGSADESYTKSNASGTKGGGGKYASGGQKSPTATGRPQKATGGRQGAAKKQQAKVVQKQSDEILHQYAEPEQLSLQQAAQQQVAGDLNGVNQQQQQEALAYGNQQTRQPGRPYMAGGGDSSHSSYGNLMMRQPVGPASYYRPRPAHQQPPPPSPSKGLLSWETISSVASGAAKRIPGALSSFLSPFKQYQQQQQQHSIYPTANYGQFHPHLQNQQLEYPKSAHYAGDVANFHRPYPFSHMSHPQSYSDLTGHGSGGHVGGGQPGGEHPLLTDSGDSSEHGEDDETDLSGASSSSSSSSSLTSEHSGDSHTLNVTLHQPHTPAGSGNNTEIIGDLAEISPESRPPAKRRPIHGSSTGSKSKGSKSRPAGVKPADTKELDPAQAAVLSSIEHELATGQAHKPQAASSKGNKRKPSGGKKTRPPVVLSAAADDDQTKTTPLVDPTILAAAHSGGSINLDSLPLDQQRLLLGKMAGAHNGLASYMKQATPPGAAGGVMFPSAAESGPHMMTSGGPNPPGGGGGGPQLNAVQIGQYKIVPQTQFVQSIIEPSRQMLGQYFRQYLGQLNQFAAG